MANKSETIAVVGLGYVGLPVALAFARKLPTLGFDIRAERVRALREHRDVTGEVATNELAGSSLTLTSDPDRLAEATFFIVAVPTPIDGNNRPDLEALRSASRTVGRALRPGAVVVYESTVYPGVTEDICAPILAAESGLPRGPNGFSLGYSPERINPGDRTHTFEKIMKVVSGEDAATLDRVADAYAHVVTAGVHRAPSIKVAEAAKVIENTQRDLNIALMNELALIFDRLGIRTRDVLDAAGTKWNFLPFSPGLVGGHCIGVDPYYLTTKAEELGYQPEVILAGRRINNGVGAYVAQRTMKMLSRAGMPLRDARVGILGLTFKEDVPDLRNSRVPDIVAELREFGIDPMVTDPLGDPAHALEEHGVALRPLSDLQNLDALIFAVPHREYREMTPEAMAARVVSGGAIVDVKSILNPADIPAGYAYWSL
ncbi:MAG TPA: nucleotide sugar dehydrogenase [Kofleriaceae bacterium]|nr:nucleotide sugar dehydrogenase [Kofleriaceae bacterium]